MTVPATYSAQSYNVFRSMGECKSEQWLSDGSLKVLLAINAGLKAATFGPFKHHYKGLGSSR